MTISVPAGSQRKSGRSSGKRPLHAPLRFAASLLTIFMIADQARSEERNPPKLVPLPKAASGPKENPTTPDKVELGRMLFFDTRLSGDNTMSCATCHLAGKAFADGRERATGHNGKTLSRNTPTLLNVGFYSELFWDGRAKSLEEQALGPIRSAEEMNQNLDELERELRAVPGYAGRFQKVFGTGVTMEGIARSLAAFERTLVTRPSPFDRYLAGDRKALSDAALRGLDLFQGNAGCIRCHHGPLLSDGKYYRLGVSFKDDGRAAVTGKKEDRGRFRTPSLRNIAQTGPFMHDGSLVTLTDVVTFYYRGVPATTPDGLPLDIQPLTGQSFSEVSDLVSFLESLSGDPPNVMPPELP